MMDKAPMNTLAILALIFFMVSVTGLSVMLVTNKTAPGKLLIIGLICFTVYLYAETLRVVV